MTLPVALVTGAGKRVGQAIAERLATTGRAVAVHYHTSRDGAADTVDRIVTAGGHAQMFQADLSAPEGPVELVAAVIAAFGRLDVLVNSAASWLRAPFGQVTAAQLDASFATNVRAPFLVSQAAAVHLAATRGVIINIADHLAYDWESPYLAHGVVKGAVESFTRGLASVLAPDVRVNAVAPGVVLLPEGTSAAVATRLAGETPLGRLGTPEDIASAVCWLADAPYVTGELVHVDGGRHLRR
jgi:pteridine reductase